MCRWVAYVGDPIPLSTLLIDTNNSLLVQSLHSKEKFLPEFMQPHGVVRPNHGANGDGFGLAWVGADGSIGELKEAIPAWNSWNLKTVTPHLRSHMFMGHLRSASGNAIALESCHPFVYGKWLFQHNGGVGGFGKLRQKLISEVRPELYEAVRGQTDSELLFYLALSKGLEDDPVKGLLGLHQTIERARREAGSTTPWAGAISVSDGTALYVLRTSSRTHIGRHKVEPSPSIYYTRGKADLKTLDGRTFALSGDSRIVSSEPVVWPYEASQWEEFPDFSIGVFLPGEEPEILPVPL